MLCILPLYHRATGWLRLAGTSGGPTPAHTRANTRIWLGCSGPWPAKFWTSPGWRSHKTLGSSFPQLTFLTGKIIFPSHPAGTSLPAACDLLRPAMAVHVWEQSGWVLSVTTHEIVEKPTSLPVSLPALLQAGEPSSRSLSWCPTRPSPLPSSATLPPVQQQQLTCAEEPAARHSTQE